ncbi:Universal stress protein UspA and related nucleotide-binding protein [Gaiella occulta]|uniref:Universal stress protein UspA and related nucleotide-binding protein n=1 Tax=Gaiella occulta TaxID=1002870 RepID=A0A7M2Z1E3_9ACTN|nr:universal stress protein [Gaiella occulta]RDI76111.1 Universal stress protein UspA and related nucleotide-binding protein [Gaiella occulta]
MKTIVVGYNESDPSDRAIERAGEMARRYGARLVVTSVVPVLIGGESRDDGSDLRNAGSLLEKMGVEAELVEAVGDPAEAIVEVAEANGADLIVVGTREPSMVERLLGHSVSENVQRRARCDVLIVH